MQLPITNGFACSQWALLELQAILEIIKEVLVSQIFPSKNEEIFTHWELGAWT